MLKIIKPRSFEDLDKCSKLYTDFVKRKGSFVETDAKRSAVFMQEHLQRQGGMFILLDDDLIIGWLMCVKRKAEFYDALIVQQSFTYIESSPIKSFRGTLMLHNEMIEWGRRRKCEWAYSTASPDDPTFQLCRMLAKDGWEVHSYLATKNIAEK